MAASLGIRQGTKGERLFDWARLPVVQGGTTDGRRWLVVRRCLDDPHELAYYLVWAPLDTSLPIMVQAIGARWHVEEDLQACKAAFPGSVCASAASLRWYRHLTLVLLAYAFLVHICVQARYLPLASGEDQGAQPAPALIPLTPSEVRHRLSHLIWPAPTSAPLICQWSLGSRAPTNIGLAITIVAVAKKLAKPLSQATSLPFSKRTARSPQNVSGESSGEFSS